MQWSFFHWIFFFKYVPRWCTLYMSTLTLGFFQTGIYWEDIFVQEYDRLKISCRLLGFSSKSQLCRTKKQKNRPKTTFFMITCYFSLSLSLTCYPMPIAGWTGGSTASSIIRIGGGFFSINQLTELFGEEKKFNFPV